MKKTTLILAFLLFCLTSVLTAQSTEPDLISINEDRISLNKNGMLVLGGWAVTNIAIGGIAMTQTSGSVKYFHQMNAAWNSVNLAIAGFGYAGARGMDSDISFGETLGEFHSLERILLFNAGLNVGYMATGAYLWERGIRTDSNRLRGYGQSMILQGGFLFVFDLTLYALSRSQSSPFLEMMDQFQVSASGVSMRISF